MQLYYYIHTGHRYGLDRLRRGAALYKQLAAQGIEPKVLLNDFRATMVAKELGIPQSTPIDSMYNIANIAQAGDGLIIDTPELNDEVLGRLSAIYRTVVTFSNTEQKHGEKIISQVRQDSNTVQLLPVDPVYFEAVEKNDKKLLFFSDEDYEKKLLSLGKNFKGFDLLLGHYFFLSYEKQLQPFFEQVVEDYEAIREYGVVASFSLQTLLEAGAGGANVIYCGSELFNFVTDKKFLGINFFDCSDNQVDADKAAKLDIEGLKKISVDCDFAKIVQKLDLGQFKFN
ncbi:MAG: hypothetical protein ACQERK_00740 [Campylobacterota bacterium]